MFTGLIREIATVRSFRGDELILQAVHRPGIGDSIAINGACLTVTKILEGGFAVELSHESRALLALENLQGHVHIEPAMQLDSRIEGHLVQGHVDGIGTITTIESQSHSWDFHIAVSDSLIQTIIPKGSIAIDGVSLTVNDVERDRFRLTIIPHTLNQTLLGGYKTGRRVNIETDMINRALLHMLRRSGDQKQTDLRQQIDSILAVY